MKSGKRFIHRRENAPSATSTGSFHGSTFMVRHSTAISRFTLSITQGKTNLRTGHQALPNDFSSTRLLA
ncbi:MAG: hypothetical protein ACLSUW_06670 [Akkermansia sp.]